MAIYQLTVNVGSRDSGGAQKHGRYIRRDEREPAVEDHDADSFCQNLPAWAATPDDVWAATDRLERKNGSVYREFQVALPVELDRKANTALVRDWVLKEFPDQFLEVGLHWKDGNPHAHVQVSERLGLGLTETAEKAFKRYSSDGSGGCKKDTRFSGESKEQARAALQQIRASWADALNARLVPAGIEPVSHQSYKDLGVAKSPGVHLGRKVCGMLKRGVPASKMYMVDRAYRVEKRVKNEFSRRLEEERTSAERAAFTADRTLVGRARRPASGGLGVARIEAARAAAPKAEGRAILGQARIVTKADQPARPAALVAGGLDLTSQGRFAYDQMPAGVGGLRKIHQAGFETPAYFAAGRRQPVAVARRDGSIVVPEPSRLTDEQIEHILHEVAGEDGRVHLFGDDAWRARADKVARSIGLTTDYEKPSQTALEAPTSSLAGQVDDLPSPPVPRL